MLTLTRPGAGTARDAVSSLKSKDPRREKPAVASQGHCDLPSATYQKGPIWDPGGTRLYRMRQKVRDLLRRQLVLKLFARRTFYTIKSL